MTDNIEKPKSLQEHIIDFIKTLATVDYEIQPLREHWKDVKKRYKENKWLDADQQKLAVKAYKMLKNQEQLEQLADFYNTINDKVGLIESLVDKSAKDK